MPPDVVQQSVPSRVAVFGAGGAGREIAWLIRDTFNDVEVFHVVDARYLKSTTCNDRRVVAFEDLVSSERLVAVCIAIGDPRERERCAERCDRAGLTMIGIVHRTAVVSAGSTIGRGSIVCPGVVIMPDVELGDFVYVNTGATVSHDCIIGDFSTLCPGVHLSGYVSVGKRVLIGTGASTINGAPNSRLIVGNDCIVGAGACVTSSVAEGDAVAGVPARRL